MVFDLNETPIASGYQQYGLEFPNPGWVDEFLRVTDVPRDKLPELIGSGQKVGGLNSAVAKATGLLEGTPLISGGGDQQCAAVGANVLSEGDCEVTLGTAGVTICSLHQPRLDPDRTIPRLVHAVDGKWTCEGLQNSAGAAPCGG